MMYNLTIQKPSLPPGTEVQIHGLGVFENGKQYLIDEAQAARFREANSKQQSEITDRETGAMRVWDEQGPTVLQAFKDDATVVVEVVKAKNPPAKNEPVTDVPPQEDATEFPKEGGE
jgi:hypothetical protein